MHILSVEHLGKNFGLKPLFDDVNFGLGDADRVGLIGANGSGKTTLLKVIAGVETPDTGRVMLAGNPVVGYLSQNPQFDDDLTVLDAIFSASSETMRALGDYERACAELAGAPGDERALKRVSELASRLEALGAWEQETNASIVLDKLGITDRSARIGTLSGGQRKRVALAHALIERPDLLILDEPTNHLDAETVEWLESYLSRFTGALLLVTHDRYFLDRVTNKIIEIDRGTVQTFAGNYEYYLEKKEEQEAVRAANEVKKAALIRSELEWLKRGAKARTTKQKARIDRAGELMAAPKEKPKAELEISVGTRRLGSKILELHGISKSYDGRKLVDGFTYILQRGDRIGIIGPNGAGKTTLLEIIMGHVEPDAGWVETGQTVSIGYYDQESSALADDLRVIDYIREVAENIKTADGSVITASQMLERFLFPPSMQYAPIGKLSGGERRRLYLLRILMAAPNVLILDEPTNDLDIQTLSTLEEYLEGFPGCLIVVSHDRYFLDRTVEHVFRFEGEGKVREYPGNYSAFLDIREREAAAAEAENRAAESRTAERAPAAASGDAPRKLSYKERKELMTLETRIEQTEKRKEELERAILEAGADYARASTLAAELQALSEQLDRDVERWSELAELA
jgi:ATP-binding cassette subfamily F protein uup